MWPMIAEPDLRCAECRHTIQPGRLCLSELPEETPVSVSRGDFKNYCIGCPQCWAQGKHACYVRHLDSGGNTGKTPRSLPCARCGRRMEAGEKAAVEIYYEWPEAAEDGKSSAGKWSAVGETTAAVGLDIDTSSRNFNPLVRGVPDGSFGNLSEGLQRKFMDAGLRDSTRTFAQAQSFYQDSIPYPVRNLGEKAVWRYVDGKDASHIQSAHNAPHLAASNDNIIWENSGINQGRGAENMTGSEHLRAQATNAFDTPKISFRECLETAKMTAFYSALLETPISVIENAIHYHKGRKTGEEAVKDAAKAIAMRAATGGVVGFAVTGAVALLGAGPLLVTIAPILMPVGLALYGLSALKRILNALKDGLPLHQVGTYFCSPRCHTMFAYETGMSALMRWEANRVAATI